MPKSALPTFVPPMMANSAKEPFDDSNWSYFSFKEAGVIG
jgi:hypothetical protein